MTERELLHVVLTCDTEKLVEALTPLNAKERAFLADRAYDFQCVMYSAVSAKLSLDGALSGVYAEFRSMLPQDATIQTLSRSASMAHWGVGAIENLEESVCSLGQLEEGDRCRVLAARGANWCQKWVEHWLHSTLPEPQLSWFTIREFVEKGLCELPHCEPYLRKMAYHLSWARFKSPPSFDDGPYLLGDYLKDNPQHISDVWRLFEIESKGFLDVPGLWDAPDPDSYYASETWAIAMRRLSEEGLMDRRRLLEASLRGMLNDFKQNLLSGFGSFHEGLSPSVDEMVACQKHYAELLAAPSARVVAFGLKMLKQIERVKSLDDTLFVDSAATVFDKKEKGPAIVVLFLFQNVARRSRAKLPAVLETVATRALLHPNVDVQEAALSFLEAWGEDADPGIRHIVTENWESLPATLRDRARLFGNPGISNHVESAVVSDGSGRLVELKTRAESLPSRWRRIAGVEGALQCMQSREVPTALNLDPFTYPIGNAFNPIEEIATVDELLDVVSAAVEGVDDADNVERILDGISRLGSDRPRNFARRAAPIVDRLKKLHGQLWSVNGIANAFRSFSEIELLLCHWLAGDPYAAYPDDATDVTGGGHGTKTGATLDAFQNGRVAEIRERVARGIAMPLLSAPTRRGGWVEPLVLVRRWSTWEAKGHALDRCDVIQALLQLLPEGRDAAAELAGDLRHPWASALRWALGAGLPTPPTGGEDDVWIAAGRARLPFEDLVFDREFSGCPGEPDGVTAAVYCWTARRERSGHPRYGEDTSETMMGLKSAASGCDIFPKNLDDTKLLSIFRPTVLLHLGRGSHVDVRWCVDWASMTWPLNRDSIYAKGIWRILGRMGEKSTSLHPNHVFLQALLNPDEPMRDTAVLATLIGLCGLDEDLRAVARDVVVDAIDDGRLDCERLSRGIGILAPAHWFKVNRLCANLTKVAHASPLHARMVAGTLEQLALACTNLAKDGHHILAPLLEMLTQLGLALEPTTAEALGEIKCSGKSAKRVKQLLALEMLDNGAMEEARRLALEARIARAERWASAGV